MSRTLELLQAEVLRLSPQDRTQLLERVIASLDVDVEAETAWDAVAEARESELDANTAPSEPLEAVLARLEARFAR